MIKAARKAVFFLFQTPSMWFPFWESYSLAAGSPNPSKYDKTKQYDARYDNNGPTEAPITELKV